MENKLQELTKKLYDEGLSRGRAEADALVSDARAEAARIVSEARAEAARIGSEAARKAEDLHRNTLTELGVAGREVVARLKSDIAGMIVARSLGDAAARASLDPAFVREMLVEVAKKWNGPGGGQVSLVAVLPAAQKEKLDGALADNIHKALGDGMRIEFSDGVESGFRVGPRDGGYYISFSDGGFDALLAEYLRPRVAGMLFGNDE